jgi:nitrogen fixation protein FixH
MSETRRMSWSTGILIAFALFGAGLGVMIWIALSSPTDLVSDDYYQRGLAYEGRIQSTRRADAGEPVEIKGKAGGVTIAIPGSARTGEAQGTVTLYRPSDRTMDFTQALSLDSAGVMRIESSRLQPGLWKVQVDWMAGGVAYYEEAKLVLN